MNNNQPLLKLIKALRLVGLLFGVFIVSAATFAEELGLDSQSGWGTGEILLALMGIFLITISLLGKKIIPVYKNTGIILLNTIVLIFLLEFLSLGFLNIFKKENGERKSVSMDYYENQQWSKDYWSEHYETVYKMYLPFVEWKRKPFSGKYININENGIRETAASDCNENSTKIFLFGGSTMWGWGAPDSLTIPSILAKELNDANEKKACIWNYGEDSYNLFHNTIDLIIQLQSGNIPDKIIFLTGANDVINSYITGNNRNHLYISDFKDKLESSGWLDILKKTNSYRLLKSFKSEEASKSENEIDKVIYECVESIFRNYMIIQGLSEKYNFSFDFFLQPVLPVTKKNLTEWEQNIDNNQSELLKIFFNNFYNLMRKESDKYNNIHYIADAFDSLDYSVFTDIMHITPEGNKIIADKIAEAVFK